jgi:hypothetical protein
MVADGGKVHAIDFRKKATCIACLVVMLFLDQIKREKGVWWMPWQ